jgi:hypothetical protein
VFNAHALRDQVCEVRDNHGRADLVDLALKRPTQRTIHGSKRLVEEKDARLSRQRASDRDTAARPGRRSARS